MVLDIIAIVVSILSVFVSVILTNIQINRNNKLNQINLESEYFRNIFTDFLVNRIPNARNELSVSIDGKITGKKFLVGVLRDLMIESIYYKYSNYEFYDELCRLIQTLEDFLIEYKDIEFKEKMYIETMIESYITDIYIYLNNEYKGLH